MITIRKSDDRGKVKIGWLDSRHTFSFGDYYDPNHMHWGPLRVINEDFVAPGAGFPTHPHANMEIVTWVLSGTLAHKAPRR
jgi:redox-sensitive bicupin YhaK (pirin superfamily)